MSYARLEVYFGLCDSGGHREGKFRKNSTSANEQQRYHRSLQHVRKYFERGWNFGLHMSPCEPLFKTREEAEQFRAFAQRSIVGASSTIELSDCIHGKIRFYRTVIFDGWVKNQKNKLITRCQQSGIQPKFELKERLERFIKSSGGSETFKKELAKLDPLQPWKDTLSFY